MTENSEPTSEDYKYIVTMTDLVGPDFLPAPSPRMFYHDVNGHLIEEKRNETQEINE